MAPDGLKVECAGRECEESVDPNAPPVMGKGLAYCSVGCLATVEEWAYCYGGERR